MKTCGGCTLCCKSLAVTELAKPQNVWCEHCEIGSGCRIYNDRPHGCRVFTCGYIQDENMPDELRPDRIHAVLSNTDDGKAVLIHIDPATPDIYRRGALGRYVEWVRQTGIDVFLVAGDRRKLLANYKQRSPFDA